MSRFFQYARANHDKGVLGARRGAARRGAARKTRPVVWLYTGEGRQSHRSTKAILCWRMFTT